MLWQIIQLNKTQARSLISTINFTMISIVDIALRSQYKKYKCCNFTERSLQIEWHYVNHKLQVTLAGL